MDGNLIYVNNFILLIWYEIFRFSNYTLMNIFNSSVPDPDHQFPLRTNGIGMDGMEGKLWRVSSWAIEGTLSYWWLDLVSACSRNEETFFLPFFFFSTVARVSSQFNNFLFFYSLLELNVMSSPTFSHVNRSLSLSFSLSLSLSLSFTLFLSLSLSPSRSLLDFNIISIFTSLNYQFSLHWSQKYFLRNLKSKNISKSPIAF